MRPSRSSGRYRRRPGSRQPAERRAEYDTERPHDVYVFLGWLPESLPNASVVLVSPPEVEALGMQELPGAGVRAARRPRQRAPAARGPDRDHPAASAALWSAGRACSGPGRRRRRRAGSWRHGPAAAGAHRAGSCCPPTQPSPPGTRCCGATCLQWADPFNPRGSRCAAHPRSAGAADSAPAGRHVRSGAPKRDSDGVPGHRPRGARRG